MVGQLHTNKDQHAQPQRLWRKIHTVAGDHAIGFELGQPAADLAGRKVHPFRQLMVGGASVRLQGSQEGKVVGVEAGSVHGAQEIRILDQKYAGYLHALTKPSRLCGLNARPHAYTVHKFRIAGDAQMNATPDTTTDFAGTMTAKLREQFEAGLLSGDELRPDFTIAQPVHRYTSTDHAIWRKLYDRQASMLQGRVCDEFLQGLATLGMERDRVPEFDQLNETLMRATGWQVVAVPGLVPDEVFFEHLANRRFPASWWMRKPEQLDYLQEPDCFHDVFGHVPLLINPIFADYMEAYGKGGLKAAKLGALDMLARLYWYTVEFGLIQTPAGLRIFGAGILSSQGESIYSLDSDSPNRIGFDLHRIMRTRYRIDTFQKTYFVIDSFEQLFDATRPDFTDLYPQLRALPTLGAGDVAEGDRVLNIGTREGWADSDDI
ncbi:Phenylalanine-4-hydroxylase [compost metagenome]